MFWFKWWHFHSRLNDFNTMPSPIEQILNPLTQNYLSNEDNISCYTKEIIPIRVIYFKSRVEKKSRPTFARISHLLQLTFNFVKLTNFCDRMFRLKLVALVMITQGYFFINFILFTCTRLLALIDCICNADSCVKIILQRTREAFYWKLYTFYTAYHAD